MKRPIILSKPSYNFAVSFALLLQQDLLILAVLEQQDFPFAHFFFLPLSAKVTPATNNAAVINTNTFFMYIILVD